MEGPLPPPAPGFSLRIPDGFRHGAAYPPGGVAQAPLVTRSMPWGCLQAPKRLRPQEACPLPRTTSAEPVHAQEPGSCSELRKREGSSDCGQRLCPGRPLVQSLALREDEERHLHPRDTGKGTAWTPAPSPTCSQAGAQVCGPAASHGGGVGPLPGSLVPTTHSCRTATPEPILTFLKPPPSEQGTFFSALRGEHSSLGSVSGAGGRA